LNEADFVSHGFKLAQGFVVIEQANVYGGEIALVQHLGNLFAFERGRPNNRRPIQIAASSDGVRAGRGFDGLTHEVCEASL